MSSGHGFHCSQCSFRFAGGWSHHEGGSPRICMACGEQFLVRSERSPWGASPNERLPVFHQRRISKRRGTRLEPTELFLTAVEIPGEQFPLLRFEPDALCCPCCRTEGAVRDSPSAGDVCPSCHRGTMVDEGLLEF